MLSLDLRTLLLAFTFARLAQAVGLFFVWRMHSHYPPVREWAAGAILSAAGMLLVGMRGIWPEWMTVAIANLVLLPGWMLFDAGIVRATGREPPWRLGLAVAALSWCWLVWHAVIDANFPVRVLGFTFAVLSFHAYAIAACWRFTGSTRRATFRLLALIMAVEAGSAVWRALDAFNLQLTSMFSPSLGQGQFLLVTFICTFLVSILLVLLAAQKLQEDADYQAHHDPLTDMLNRRSLDECAEHEWSRAVRHDFPLSCLMVDIDHFKRFNDEHGHRAGDSALIHVAQVARSALRTEDVWARYGGEEFVAMLPNTSAEQAEVVAERVRRAIAESMLLTPQGEAWVTVSIGIAERQSGHERWDQMLDAADQALYAAKGRGRNCVVVADA